MISAPAKRFLAFALAVFPLSPLLAQQPGYPPKFPTFALPTTTWITADRPAQEILDPVVLSTIRREYGADCEDCHQAVATPVSLGKLGAGTFLQLHGSLCGATGNCQFLLVTHRGGRERVFLVGYGWSFAVAPRPGGIPDIFTQANMSCCSGIIERFTYTGDTFVQNGCDAIDGAIGTNGPLAEGNGPRGVRLTIQPC